MTDDPSIILPAPTVVSIRPDAWESDTEWDAEGPGYEDNLPYYPPPNATPEYSWIYGKQSGKFVFRFPLPSGLRPGYCSVSVTARVSSTEWFEVWNPRYSDVSVVMNGVSLGTRRVPSLQNEGTVWEWHNNPNAPEVPLRADYNVIEFRVGDGDLVYGLTFHFEARRPGDANSPIEISIVQFEEPPPVEEPPPLAFTDFRPWHGQLGPTASFADGDRLWVINQDKYWVWRPLSGWLAAGFLGELWQDAPTVRADAPRHMPPIGGQFEPSVALLDKRPYDYPGVSAAYVPDWDTGERPYVVLIQHSRYWEKHLGAPGWRFSGRLADTLFGTLKVDGVLPWTHAGVTAAYSRHDAVVLIQRDRYWEYDDEGERVDEGWLRNRWPTAPTVGGMRPWEGNGVRGMCTYGSFLGVSSNDRFWLLDLASDLWIDHGHLSNMWKLAPGIDVSLVHAMPAAEANITLGMGELDKWVQEDGPREGHGHLGEDIAPKDCTHGPGQTIRSIAAGKVVSIPGPCGNYYNPMAIEHLVHDIPEVDGPIYSFYGHVEALKAIDGIAEGNWVKAGAPIAVLPDPCKDNFGFAAHVHLEVKSSNAHLYGPPAGPGCHDPERGRLVSMGYASNILGDTPSDFDEPAFGWHDLGNCQRELAPGALCRFYVPTRFVSERGGGPRPAFGPPCECVTRTATSTEAPDVAVRREPRCPAGILHSEVPIVPGPGPDPTRAD